jgi:hypothetical protein
MPNSPMTAAEFEQAVKADVAKIARKHRQYDVQGLIWNLRKAHRRYVKESSENDMVFREWLREQCAKY